MIISRTPYRISLFGGGTDYPVWYRSEKGAVLAATIDKYCYLTCRWLPPFFEHRHRLVYSRIENVSRIDEIEHPAARECMRLLQIESGVEIHHDGDLPARTGLGSSSAFTVGLLHALHALKGEMRSKLELGREAIHVEQDRIGENVGSQDQMIVANGGMCHIEFHPGDRITVERLPLSQERSAELNRRLMLFFTGFSRTASDVAAEQIQNTASGRNDVDLRELYGMVFEAEGILGGGGDLAAIGELLHESWCIKRGLSSLITNPRLDEIYDAARRSGAIGGKLLGAGGGGFLLFFVEPEHQSAVRAALAPLLYVPFHFEENGSQLIFYEQSSNAI
jgi:D-glycero-alpha-D-manno-heptose-7-phosphate kinase